MSAVLRLRVVPNAKRSEVVGVHGDALKVKVQAPAMDGKANEALLDFLAGKLGLPRRDVLLIAGEKSRDKTIRVADLEVDEVRRRLLDDGKS